MSQKRRRRERYAHPGDLVYIVEDCGRQPPVKGQVAVYEGRFDYKGKRVVSSRGNWNQPRFRLKDGSSILGMECWWVPFRKAVDTAKDLGPDGVAGLQQLYTARNEFRGWGLNSIAGLPLAED